MVNVNCIRNMDAASMGPQPVGRGEPFKPRLRYKKPEPCFNGATASRPWRVGQLREFVGYKAELQWGHSQ